MTNYTQTDTDTRTDAQRALDAHWAAWDDVAPAPVIPEPPKRTRPAPYDEDTRPSYYPR